MNCPHCRYAVLSVIRVSLVGSRFTMRSCPSCESRWWDADGEPIALDKLLTAVAGG